MLIKIETDELSEPVLPEGTNSNGESNGAAAIAIAESDETSPVKRSRSAEAEDEEEAAGKRVKLGGESSYHHTGVLWLT